MFLVSVENIPNGYHFFESNRRSFDNLINYFCLSNSQAEILIFSEYDSALDVVLQFNLRQIWDQQLNKAHCLRVKINSLCINPEMEE